MRNVTISGEPNRVGTASHTSDGSRRAAHGHTATAVIEPPVPESKFEMFEESRGAAVSSPPWARRDALRS